jgi:hypothetical protein
MDDIKNLLIYLAKNANIKRFYPFPDYLRICSSKTKTRTKKDKLPSGMKPYSSQEEARLKTELADIYNKPAMMEYILNINVSMSYHGKSICNSIDEYQFRYDDITERLRDSITKKRWYLFHGSPIGNWHSIIRNGIRNTSNTGLMTTGTALGEGVYLTGNLTTAREYGRSGGTSFVAVVELFEDPEKYKKSPVVYVIPNDKLLIPRYLYKIKGPFPKDIKDILKYYKKIKEKMISTKIANKRLDHEIKELLLICEMVEHIDETINIIYKGILFQILIDGFPYKVPVIRSLYRLTKQDGFNNQFCMIINDWTPMNTLVKTMNDINLHGVEMTDEIVEIKYDHF